ncbi:hypothetical protein ACJX0J_036244, partial [Zea mays]
TPKFLYNGSIKMFNKTMILIIKQQNGFGALVWLGAKEMKPQLCLVLGLCILHALWPYLHVTFIQQEVSWFGRSSLFIIPHLLIEKLVILAFHVTHVPNYH